MIDVQRYRANAAECLSAAERSAADFRGLTLAIAASWLSLARQQQTMDDLLAIWSKAQPTSLAPRGLRPFRYPSCSRVTGIRAEVDPPCMTIVRTALPRGTAFVCSARATRLIPGTGGRGGGRSRLHGPRRLTQVQDPANFS